MQETESTQSFCKSSLRILVQRMIRSDSWFLLPLNAVCLAVIDAERRLCGWHTGRQKKGNLAQWLSGPVLERMRFALAADPAVVIPHLTRWLDHPGMDPGVQICQPSRGPWRAMWRGRTDESITVSHGDTGAAT